MVITRLEFLWRCPLFLCGNYAPVETGVSPLKAGTFRFRLPRATVPAHTQTKMFQSHAMFCSAQVRCVLDILYSMCMHQVLDWTSLTHWMCQTYHAASPQCSEFSKFDARVYRPSGTEQSLIHQVILGKNT